MLGDFDPLIIGEWPFALFILGLCALGAVRMTCVILLTLMIGALL